MTGLDGDRGRPPAAEGRRFTPEQAAAVSRRDGSLLLSANAGSGKTTVLAERFVRSTLEDGIAPDAMLAITFTDKAAGELRKRIRERFVELDARDAARDAEAAWISTIHGFCARVLRAHAVTAGLDPGFTVLDDSTARALRSEAFERAFARFLEPDPTGAPRLGALDLSAAWTPDRLRTAILGVHDELRSRGHSSPRLPPVRPAPLEPLHAALAQAAAAAATDLAQAKSIKSVDAARDALAACREAVAAQAPGEPLAPPQLLAASFKPGGANALKSDPCRRYLEAHAAYAAACRDRRALSHHALLDELLASFAGEYAAAKRRASALDFDDLELHVRDLFGAQPAVAATFADRFRRIMVDELQDTNPLQLEILGHLDREDLFFVGDELQSIYGFRHADVGGFRRKRAEMPAAELTINWRSRPEILETLNAAFGDVHERYSDLRAGRTDAPDHEPRVELLLTDAPAWDAEDADAELIALRARLGTGLPPAPPSRHAEARAVARRVRELVDGGVSPQDVAVLLRAATDMGLYERALELEGLATLATGGRGFWARRQVQDLLGYLGALVNPRDELALWTLLASPLVGLSADALALLALGSREHGVAVWDALERELCAGGGGGDPAQVLAARLPEADRERLGRFCPWFAAERALAPRLGLDVVLQRAIDAAAYREQVLALPGGRRRLANVHKLLRLAAAFESRRGRDERGFIEYATAELEADAREPEAPVELAGLEAVRLMTIHAAKGLEFPVVVVADLGRRGNAAVPDLLVDGDEVGVRLIEVDGDSEGAFAHEELKRRAQAAQAAEERRVMHVAFTRAEERLILSGAVCAAKPWPANGPASPPLGWLGPALAEHPAQLIGPQAAERDLDEVRSRGRLRLRVRRNVPADAEPHAGTPGTVSVATEPAGRADARRPEPPPRPALTPVPAVASLSYSALASYAACGYRFYLERVLRLRPDEGDIRLHETAAAAPGIDARLRGTLAHQLLEALDFAAPRAPTPDAVRDLARRLGTELTDAEVEDLRRLVDAFATSGLCRRLAACQDVHREQQFTFVLEHHLLTGVVDVRARGDAEAVVVDYKSDAVAPHTDLEAFVERDYGAQRRIYALAELRAGAAAVEVVHLFLERAGEPVIVRYDQGDAPRLEAELRDLTAGVAAGRFPVAVEPHRGLCLGCPGRRVLCSHDEAATLREPPGPASEGAPSRPAASGSGAPPWVAGGGAGGQGVLFAAAPVRH